MRLFICLVALTVPFLVSVSNGDPTKCAISEEAKKELDDVKKMIDQLQTLIALLFGPAGETCEDAVCEPLSCPTELQITYPGICCPSCPEDYGLDPCLLAPPCAPLTCPESEQIKDEGACCARCPECFTICPLFYAPVCGTDGVTYPNECSLNVAKCNQNSDLAIATTGTCPEERSHTISNFAAESLDQTVRLSWSAPSNTDIVIGYVVKLYDGDEVTTDRLSPFETDYERNDLKPGTSYNITVIPIQRDGPGVTVSYHFKTDQIIPDEYSVESISVSVSGTTISLSWVPPNNTEILRGYVLRIVSDDDENDRFQRLSAFEISYEFDDLEPGVRYNLTFTTVKIDGPGETEFLTFKTVKTLVIESVDPCENIVCDVPVCPDGHEIATEPAPGECCLGCIDPCKGIQCGIPSCEPLGLVISYDEGCCPTCIDKCAKITCIITDCTTIGKVASVFALVDDCCPTCVEPCAEVVCAPIPCEEGFELETELPTGRCCPICVEKAFSIQTLTGTFSGQFARIEWTPPINQDILQGYIIRIVNADGQTLPDRTLPASRTSYNVRNLEPDTLYNLTITPVKIDGEGEPIMFRFTTDPETIYTDCSDAFSQGQTTTGTYRIQPDANMESFTVRCDMDTDGGKWTTVLKRDGTTDIEFAMATYAQYEAGFGDVESEYFIGLMKLYGLLKAGNTIVRFDMSAFDGDTAYAQFNRFTMDDASKNYKLKTAAGYSGTAGNSLHYSKGMEFSTRDADNDQDSGSCAFRAEGAGWFKNVVCTRANIFGDYKTTAATRANTGMFWASFKGQRTSLASMEMKVRAP